MSHSDFININPQDKYTAINNLRHAAKIMFKGNKVGKVTMCEQDAEGNLKVRIKIFDHFKKMVEGKNLKLEIATAGGGSVYDIPWEMPVAKEELSNRIFWTKERDFVPYGEFTYTAWLSGYKNGAVRADSCSEVIGEIMRRYNLKPTEVDVLEWREDIKVPKNPPPPAINLPIHTVSRPPRVGRTLDV